MMKTGRILFLVFAIMVPIRIFGVFPINVFRPYDINLRTPAWPGQAFQITGWGEIGRKTKAYNAEGKQVTPLQVFQPDQNTLAMLQGFGPNSPEQEFFENVLMSPTDDGQRGHMFFNGDFKMKGGFGINARYNFPHNLSFGIFLPFYSMRLKNVTFQDRTNDSGVLAEDIKVRENLTSKLTQVVAMFDEDLNLTGWKKTGIGDLALLVEWWRDFPQAKPLLKNVGVHGRAGLTLPTGVTADADDILSIPFGCDGATGILFAAGLDMTWFDCLPWVNQIRGGFDVEFLQLFGTTKERRIKTDVTQTNWLLLAKEQVHRDFGFTQRYNLYLEAHRLLRGLSLSATYQFWKQSESTLALCSNRFSTEIANTDEALQEWTIHQLLFAASYDTECDVSEDSLFKPQLKFIYKYPFGGQRSVVFDSFTLVLSLNF